jgi:hypothetical protein
MKEYEYGHRYHRLLVDDPENRCSIEKGGSGKHLLDLPRGECDTRLAESADPSGDIIAEDFVRGVQINCPGCGKEFTVRLVAKRS